MQQLRQANHQKYSELQVKYNELVARADQSEIQSSAMEDSIKKEKEKEIQQIKQSLTRQKDQELEKLKRETEQEIQQRVKENEDKFFSLLRKRLISIPKTPRKQLVKVEEITRVLFTSMESEEEMNANIEDIVNLVQKMLNDKHRTTDTMTQRIASYEKEVKALKIQMNDIDMDNRAKVKKELSRMKEKFEDCIHAIQMLHQEEVNNTQKTYQSKLEDCIASHRRIGTI